MKDIEVENDYLLIKYLDFFLVLDEFIDISVNKIPALATSAMTAYIHRITFVLCFAIGVFNSLRIFFHKHMVKFLNIANDIQAVEITESAFEVQLKCFHR